MSFSSFHFPLLLGVSWFCAILPLGLLDTFFFFVGDGDLVGVVAGLTAVFSFAGYVITVF